MPEELFELEADCGCRCHQVTFPDAEFEVSVAQCGLCEHKHKQWRSEQ